MTGIAKPEHGATDYPFYCIVSACPPDFRGPKPSIQDLQNERSVAFSSGSGSDWQRSFLPRRIGQLGRRAPEVAEVIRQASLRGVSTRQVDGVWLKVRRAFGPQRVLLLVAYGIRQNGTRELLAFTRAKSESQVGFWEGLLNDLFRGELRGRSLQLVLDWRGPWKRSIRECGTSAAGCTKCGVSWRRCGRRDDKQIKAHAQKIYLAENVAAARRASERFRFHWRPRYPAMVRQLERDLPELQHFFVFPRHLWRKLRTTNVIERCFVEVRRRTQPMVVFTNIEIVDRII